jgi:uncharacterized Zn finger protein
VSGWYPPPSRPRPVEGGLKARSRRGAIGETWWSRRFIDLLESFRLGGRLDRGRRYARAGQVLDLQVAAGLVSARVQGSRVRPYRVRLETPVLAPSDWERVEQAMAGRAAFAARLLAGEMPHDIEETFAAAGVSLFPASPRNLASSCSCPDWSNPCKHVAAVYYLLAEAFDDDPFLIFAWRGRTRSELLGRLRRARATPAGWSRRSRFRHWPNPSTASGRRVTLTRSGYAHGQPRSPTRCCASSTRRRWTWRAGTLPSCSPPPTGS